MAMAAKHPTGAEAHPAKAHFAEAHFAKAFLIPFDLDSEPIFCFQNANFVQYLVFHHDCSFALMVSFDNLSIAQTCEDIVKMLWRCVEDSGRARNRRSDH
jgi:hypothetical protein